jgi:uncharacterized protein with HEPN domain
VKDERLYLVHITECIERVRRFTASGRTSIFEDEMARDAVLRNLQVMAESTQRLSDATRARHPGINWQKIRQFRNIVVHEYLGVDLDIVWGVVENDLDPLERAMGAELRLLDQGQAGTTEGGAG